MRIQVFSDLHMDAAASWQPQIAPGADVVVCAGDVCEGMAPAISYLRERLPGATPIVTVAGNHSFYRRCVSQEIDEGRIAATALRVSFLEIDAVVHAGVRFVGCTLWTDYRLYGEDMRQCAMDLARRGMNDHRLITWQKQPWLRFRPQEAARLHDESVAYLDAVLSVPFDGPTVVVTHHAPHPRSIHPKYQGDVINAAYASDLTNLILKHRPPLWIHGHVHSPFDYVVDETRIVCNPHGYGSENAAGFIPDLIVEV